MKRKPLLAASLLATAMALAACGPTVPGLIKTGHVDMTLTHDTIPAGTTFYDGCLPKVVDEDTNADISNYFNQLVFTINPIVDGAVDTSVSYGADDALPEGTYRANLQARSSVVEVDFTVSPDTSVEASEGKGYTTVYGGEGTEFDRLALSKADSSLGTLGVGNFPSKGSPKMIVIPIYFADMKGSAGSTNGTFSAEELDIIERAYFGTNWKDTDQTKRTSWESLHSYYLTSSYGKLDIEGLVTDPFQSSYTQSEIETGSAATLVTEAWNWFKANHQDEDLRDYDYNGDGYVDSINLIYKTTRALSGSGTESGGNDFWWNYTSNVSGNPNVNSPVPHRFFFASLSMIRSNYYPDFPVIDSHVLVHEHGHAMGLADYYSYLYDEKQSKVDGAPAGCADMMDMNVGDHNAYSKMRFDWLKENPDDTGLDLKYIDGSADNFTITIDSYADEGDVIVVRNTSTDPWNKTPYDEYLIITYYTPTGVNDLDSEGYGEWLIANESTGSANNGNGGPYKYPGIQIFHVDARVGASVGTWEEDPMTGKVVETKTGDIYTDKIYQGGTHYEGEGSGTYESAAYFLTSNTSATTLENRPGSEKIVDGKRTEGGDAEIRAILSSGVDSFSSTSYYNNFGVQSNLFGTKEYGEEKGFLSTERYGGNTYSNYQARAFFQNQEELLWNDGSFFNWTISVESQTDESATLHFVNNESID